MTYSQAGGAFLSYTPAVSSSAIEIASGIVLAVVILFPWALAGEMMGSFSDWIDRESLGAKVVQTISLIAANVGMLYGLFWVSVHLR